MKTALLFPLVVVGLFLVCGCSEAVVEDEPVTQQHATVTMHDECPRSFNYLERPDVITSEMLEADETATTIDLKADVQWRQVTLIDREAGKILDTWVTGEPVQFDTQDYMSMAKTDGLGCVLVGGHTIIEQLTDEVGERIKDDPDAQKKHAEQTMTNIGLSL